MPCCRTRGSWLQARVEAGEDIHLVVWHGVTDNSLSLDGAGRGSRSPVRHSPNRQRERVLEFCDHDPGWRPVGRLFGLDHGSPSLSRHNPLDSAGNLTVEAIQAFTSSRITQ